MQKSAIGALAFIGAGGAYLLKKYKENPEETSFLSSMGGSGGTMPTANPPSNAVEEDEPITNNFYFGDEINTSDDVLDSKQPSKKESKSSSSGSGASRKTAGGVKVYPDNFIGPIERDAVRGEGKVYPDNFIGPIERDAVRESTSKKEAAARFNDTQESTKSWWKFW